MRTTIDRPKGLLGTAKALARGRREPLGRTDAYLARLARRHEGRVATPDRGRAASHPDVAHLVSTTGGDNR